jgi:hypothetical protein
MEKLIIIVIQISAVENANEIEIPAIIASTSLYIYSLLQLQNKLYIALTN